MDSGSLPLLLAALYLTGNGFSFLLMLDDKKRSRRNERRISEAALLFAAICFGAAGVLAGMLIGRHKTQKTAFILGVPLALLQNLSFFYFIYANSLLLAD